MLMRRLLMVVSTAPAALALVFGVICLADPHRPLFYLIDIFSVAGLTGTLALTALLWLLRASPARWVATAALGIFVLAIWSQAFPHQPPADRTRPAVRLAFANMLIRNREPEKILPWIARQKPDIVAMVEVNPAAREDLFKALKADRPYVVTRYDMIIASRWPLSNVRRGGTGFGLMSATVATPDGDLTVAVTHLTRPWPYSDPSDQPRQFSRLAEALGSVAGRRFVMVGDFNTPPCASAMKDFMRREKLHAAPALFGTWISVLPGALRVTIDNAMASGDLHLSRRKVGAFDGSDHRPIVVDILPAKAG